MVREGSKLTARFLTQETEGFPVPLTKVSMEEVTRGRDTQLATVKTRGAGGHLVIFFYMPKASPK